MEAAFIILNAAFALTSVSVSYGFMIHFPKETNNVFGYRTRRSMASPAAWLFANRYSSRLLFKLSRWCVGLQVILCFFFSLGTALVTTIVLWMIALFVTIIATEINLKQKLAQP